MNPMTEESPAVTGRKPAESGSIPETAEDSPVTEKGTGPVSWRERELQAEKELEEETEPDLAAWDLERPASAAARKAGRRRRKVSGWIVSWLMILPAIAFLLIFTIYPMANIFRLSLYRGNALNPTKQFVSLDNFREIFLIKTDFLVALKNTAYYTVMVIIFLIALSLLFALWLRADRKINQVSQVLLFTPYLIATISCAFIWSWLYNKNDYGLFNTVLGWFHLGPVNWLNDSGMAMNCIIVMNVWKNIGYYALIILASLKSIPAEIDEAALLDQAGPLRKFFRITLPLLSPQLFFILITITTGSFKVFDSVRIMTNGGPGDATRVISMYIYDYAFQRNNTLGVASAAGVVLVGILVMVTIFYFRCLEKRVHYR